MPDRNSTKTARSAYTDLLRRIVRRGRRRHLIDPAVSDIAAIKASGRFDEAWYLGQYPDVAASGMDPIEHYVRHGAAEERNPCADFDTRFYLRTYRDVLRAEVNPFRHYIEHGSGEGRAPTPTLKGKILNGPLVSIVIPIYAVEDYLPACLDSVLKQTYYNLEIIIVDDGSPDRSFEIADVYAKSDPRIKILRKENNGLGAARNTGIAAATGPYLAFVDSDDLLPSGAIARMVATIQRTGSDFVVGGMRRLRHGKLMPPDGWVKEVHAEDRMGIRLNDFPKILTDVFAWNKLFDSAFFRREVISFPEKIRYEDQEATALAYLKGRFDVLAETVYHWRIREDGTSITQKKSDPEDLRDRLLVKKRVSRILEDAEATTYEAWLVKALGFDLRPYFEQVPRTDMDFFQQLRAGMQELAGRMTPLLWQRVRMIDRLPALAILAGSRDDVCVAITRRSEYGYFVPSQVRGGEAYLDRSYLDGMSLSPDDKLLRLGEADLTVIACATSLWWHGSKLYLEGFAYVTNIEFADDSWISARLVSGQRPPVVLGLSQLYVPRIDRESRDAWSSYARSGFAVEIDPLELALDPDSIWQLEITVGCSRMKRGYSTILRDADVRGMVEDVAISPVSGGARWSTRFEPGMGFILECKQSQGLLITSFHTSNNGITIVTGQSVSDVLVLTCNTLRARVEVNGIPTGNDQVTFRIELPDLEDDDSREHLWDMRLHGSDASRPLLFPGNRADLEKVSPEHYRVRAVMGTTGALSLIQSSWWAVVDEVDVNSNAIVIRGRIDAPATAVLAAHMTGETQQLHADQVTFDHGMQQFEARIPFDPAVKLVRRSTAFVKSCASHDSAAGMSRSIEEQTAIEQVYFQPTTLHGFSMRLSICTQERRCEHWLRVATNLQRKLPSDETAARYGLSLTRTPRASALWVRFLPPYHHDERGQFAQRRLHAWIQGMQACEDDAATRLQDAVLFESFGGKQVSDSVLAICEEIRRRNTGLALYWTVSDMGMSVPDGTTPLLIHSRAWMYQLHHTRYLVNNNNFPFYFRKRPGQIYLQTWHGTPLKKIGNDVPHSNLSLSYRCLMARESKYWDFLLAQNDYAADVLPRSFGFDGQVLNVGYPRNDVLAKANANSRRLTVRNHLGFEPYHFVVLYAPTWRDNLSGAHGYKRVAYLNPQIVRRALGSNTRIVLRGHQNTAKDPAKQSHGVIDATNYPNINDLLLAADLLITDYSSVMFDYAITGKPMVYLTPDLDLYKSTTRGFYLDFEKVAPGPICISNDELGIVLNHLGNTLETYMESYAVFRSRFTPNDDGNAATRVVDAIWTDTREKS